MEHLARLFLLALASFLLGAGGSAQAATPTLRTEFPEVNGTVYALVVDKTRGVVDLGGDFSTVGGQARSRFAAIKDPTLPTAAAAKIAGKKNRTTPKPTLLITGTANWKFTAKLKPGKNLITVVATGEGGKSPPSRITVIRQ